MVPFMMVESNCVALVAGNLHRSSQLCAIFSVFMLDCCSSPLDACNCWWALKEMDSSIKETSLPCAYVVCSALAPSLYRDSADPVAIDDISTCWYFAHSSFLSSGHPENNRRVCAGATRPKFTAT